jgi:hypothetical protein
MKSLIHMLPVMLAGALIMTACDRSPTASPMLLQDEMFVARSAADHEVEESLTDMDGVFFTFACSPEGQPLEQDEGELVRMQGHIYQKYTVRRDAQDGFHITFQTMPVGLAGTGVTSGEPFRVVEREHGTHNQTQAGLNGAWRSELKLTGKDTGRTFWLVFSGNYRVSSDGGIIVDRDRQTVSCKPGRRA